MTHLVSLIGSPDSLHRELNAAAAAYAQKLGLAYSWRPQPDWSPDGALAALADADAAIVNIEPYDADLLSRLDPRTRLLIRFGVGYDAVDVEAASRHGIAIARTPHANARAVAEMSLALLLAVRRDLTGQSLAGTAPWAPRIGEDTVGSVGIVGLGAVGKTLAKLLSGFGVHVVAYGSNAHVGDGVDEVVDDLDALVSAVDAISLHLPHTAATHHLFDRARIARMKPGAVLINTARGSLIDEGALIDALRSGALGGAGLDVFETEPLAADSPLRTLPNVVLTPHAASQTRQALASMYTMCVDIAHEYSNGGVPPHVLNPLAVRREVLSPDVVA